ncbi:hypothetical protein EOD39_9537 [Acipenser ruthenus]|uniref:HAT C-terminal dimerisation domain-containing protein n=1 Tax=Acipenser ruthenus TaxID=7906 RepID=A0A444U0F9_ACIRT|nr:hypothetical protein EOD39_9537 [Acipenser ruthenus]
MYIMPTATVYLHYDFTSYADGLKDKKAVESVKEKCKGMLVQMAHQSRARLPANISILEKLDMLHPKEALSQLKISITTIAQEFQVVCQDIGETEKQWSNLTNKTWGKTGNESSLWFEVYEDRDAAGDSWFGHVAQLALTTLALPVSNAAVERTVSTVTIIKTKLRNRLQCKTLESLLQVKYCLEWRGQDCRSFHPTPQILQKFNSNMYNITKKQDCLEAPLWKPKPCPKETGSKLAILQPEGKYFTWLLNTDILIPP